MRNVRLTIAYEGTNYAGWQVQPEQSSVQGTIEGAIERLTGETIRIHGAGRTDAGVHAIGQVAHFHTESTIPPERFAPALNRELPKDIIIHDSREVPDEFHARYSAVRKQYRYLIDTAELTPPAMRDLVWRVHGAFDEVTLTEAATRLIGRHDFSAFESKSSPDEDSCRTVQDIVVSRVPSAFGWHENHELLAIAITADGFLYNMVRSIVGTMVEVAQGRWTTDDVTRMLKSRDRSQAGSTAPPHGLCLMWVDYAGADQLHCEAESQEIVP
ncbi:MAG: tRNA pseudouridine(38-40) synthase TruA [Planctomycetaceae bacterium]|nr:tRNA pseudouridine(38-40) synthase TruA [Planctomycetaceae bacterium]